VRALAWLLRVCRVIEGEGGRPAAGRRNVLRVSL
jgi:hypothetical protein